MILLPACRSGSTLLLLLLSPDQESATWATPTCVFGKAPRTAQPGGRGRRLFGLAI